MAFADSAYQDWAVQNTFLSLRYSVQCGGILTNAASKLYNALKLLNNSKRSILSTLPHNNTFYEPRKNDRFLDFMIITWLLILFQLYCSSQCTYPCFPFVSNTPHNILSKPLIESCQNDLSLILQTAAVV